MLLNFSRIHVLFVAAVAVLAVACGGSSPSTTPPAAETPAPAAAPAPPTSGPMAVLRVTTNVGSGNWKIAGVGDGVGSSFVDYAVRAGVSYAVDPGYVSTGYDEPPMIVVPPLNEGETREVIITYTPK